MDPGMPNNLLDVAKEQIRNDNRGPMQSGALINTFGILGRGRGLAVQLLRGSADQPAGSLCLSSTENVSDPTESTLSSDDESQSDSKNEEGLRRKQRKSKRILNAIRERMVRDAPTQTRQQAEIKLLKADKKGKLSKVLKKYCLPSSSTTPECKEEISKQVHKNRQSKILGNCENIITTAATHPTSYKFKIGKFLGIGSFGKVSLVTDSQGGQFALKIVGKQEKFLDRDGKSHDSGLWEVKILKLLKELGCGNHHCCELIKSYALEKARYFQFPLYGPTLRDRIFIMEHGVRFGGRGFPVSQVREILRQLLTALHFLHSHHIVHLDLKTNNVLFLDGNWTAVTDSNSYCVKMNNPEIRLIDFGMSITHPEKLRETANVCCLTYRPPESILKSKISYPVDIWCAGLIAVAMYAGNDLFWKPHSHLEVITQMNAALGPFPPQLLQLKEAERYFIGGKIRNPYTLEFSSTFIPRPLRELKRKFGTQESDHLVDLITDMLNLDSSKRITSEEALSKINNF